MSLLPSIIPHKEIVEKHDKQFHPKGSRYTVTGTNKKEKLKGVYCEICKKYITPITFRTSSKRR